MYGGRKSGLGLRLGCEPVREAGFRPSRPMGSLWHPRVVDVGRILVRAAVGGYRLGSYVMLAFIGAVLLIAPWWALSGIPAMAVLFAVMLYAGTTTVPTLPK